MEVDDITVYLDSVDGDDATGVLNDINYPYKTLNAGYYAARASSAIVPVDLTTIKGSFDLTSNPNIPYYLFNLSDSNDSSMTRIDQLASFQNCIFDINMSITLSGDVYSTGISISGLFASAAGRIITITESPGRVPIGGNFDVIINGSVSSDVIILSDVNIVSSHTVQYIKTVGNIYTTYPDISMNLFSGTGMFNIIQVDILAKPCPTVIALDNTSKISGITSTIQYNYSPTGAFFPDVASIGTTTGLVFPIQINNVNLNSIVNVFSPATPVNYLISSFGGIAIDDGSDVPELRKDASGGSQGQYQNRCDKYKVVLHQTKPVDLTRSLIITSSYFTLQILTLNVLGMVNSYVTNTNSFSVVQTNLNGIDIPIASIITIIIPGIQPLYAVNNQFMAYNNNGAIIYNPVTITSAYTPPKYFGTLFYVEAASNFNIMLNHHDVSGRILIFKRIDDSSAHVRIIAPGRFDGKYKYVTLMSTNKGKCKCKNKLHVSAITIAFKNDGKYLILSSN